MGDMIIDWDIVIRIVVPLITLLIGKYLDTILQKRSKLISYLGHTSAFNIKGEQPLTINTHEIVIKNAGREAAKNVRIGHYTLPDHNLIPAVQYKVENTPGGISEIVIERIVPGDQITISYLYFPPLYWNQINAYTKSDEGNAKIINVLPSPQPAKWLSIIALLLFFLGVVTFIYLIIQITIFFIMLTRA